MDLSGANSDDCAEILKVLLLLFSANNEEMV